MDCPKRASVAAGLSDDPLVEILSRVPAKSLCRFKCVSKAWRDLINDPFYRKKLPQAMEGLFLWAKSDGRCDSDGDVRHLSFVDLTARSVPLDIDSSFSSVLTGLPETETLDLVDFCNGLMLLEHRRKLDPDDTLLGYIVFNPTTRQRATVPTCSCPISPLEHPTYLAFDPAISSHFHLIQLRDRCEPEGEEGEEITALSVHAYSSKTGTWSHNQTTWDELAKQGLDTWYRMGIGLLRAFVNGMLHLFVSNEDSEEHQILAIDVQGVIQRTISLPVPTKLSPTHQHFVANSQGLLHYIIQDFRAKSRQLHLHVWVLQEYDAKEWVQKDTVCIPKLVGKWNCMDQLVATHQDCNVFFFVQDWNHKLMSYDKLIAYDMDSKEVSVLAASGNKSLYLIVAPYVPYFAHSPVLTNKD